MLRCIQDVPAAFEAWSRVYAVCVGRFDGRSNLAKVEQD